MNSRSILTVRSGSAEFPSQLLDLDVVPDPIYAIGDLAILRMPLVAIVGTREPTAYGLRAARSIATALVENGAGIVSGMARGIDRAVHDTTLALGGTTVAVLGTGIDVPYPAGHRELHRVIGMKGLVISERPAGSLAHRGAFPRRNRIIAALAKVTIVVEAGLSSGARNTAGHALEIGRPLAAVPGPIDSPQSAGTNLLLRDGAAVISSPDDALALAGITSRKQSPPLCLEEVDAQVWSAIGAETLPLDSIAARARIGTRECIAAITSLELSGMVESLVTGEIRRRV